MRTLVHLPGVPGVRGNLYSYICIVRLFYRVGSREPGCVWECGGCDIGEGIVFVVAVEVIWAVEVVGDVEVGVAVVVVIPPDDAEAHVVAVDTCFFGDIDEVVAPVEVEFIVLARADEADGLVGFDEHVDLFFEVGGDCFFSADVNELAFDLFARCVSVGEEVGVEVTIAVNVCEVHGDRCAGEVEFPLFGLFGEAGLAIIDVESVGA